MSDCSTNAMKPKEPPKTCGNCALCKVCNPSPEVPCVGWIESAESVLQRYQRLENVAKDLYAALHINEKCSMEFIPDKGRCSYFKERLRDCGVSLDD